MSHKSYNKRNFVEIEGAQVDRENCVMNLLKTTVFGHEVYLASNRAYKKMPDGSFRRVKREEAKEWEREYKEKLRNQLEKVRQM